MAREYVKAVIENIAVENKSDVDVVESCEDLDEECPAGNSMGLESPGGVMRGRSVKEFEEQLTNLKKENFNLKLRIYFLEERMGVNFSLDKENIIKKNVELMVEVENLRKQVEEKHDLLCQAVKAMELEDEEHKKLLREKDSEIWKYQDETENLKSQLIDLKLETDGLTKRSDAFDYNSIQVQSEDSSSLNDLQERINLLEEELHHEKENTAAIQIVLDQNEIKIKSLTSQLEEANNKIACRENESKSNNFELDEIRTKYNNILKLLQEKSQQAEELASENQELRKRENLFCVDLEKEHKRYNKLKVNTDQKVADLQCKLEASLAELKKSQELVVSKTSGRRSGNTDADSFSVQKSATSPRSPQKDTFFLPTIPSPVVTPTSSPSTSFNFIVDNTVDVKQIIERLKNDRDMQHQKIIKLKAEQMKACKIIKSMIDSRNKTNEEIAALKLKNEELERELEGVVQKQKAESSYGESAVPSSYSNESKASEVLKTTLTEEDFDIKSLTETFEHILKDNNIRKEERVLDLEYDFTDNQNQNERVEEEGQTIEFYIQELREKDSEIERLNAKLLKRNCDLQGLVNKELWEKNREIEKLQNDLKNKEKQLVLIKGKIAELGIEVNIINGDVNFHNNLELELAKSEKLRLEANKVCSILSTRLQELALFLNSLLEQKAVLGFFDTKDNKKLRHIIDRSLDLSRSLSLSLSAKPQESLLQLTNISNILNDSEFQLTEVTQNLSQNIDNFTEEPTQNDIDLNISNIGVHFSNLFPSENTENKNVSNSNLNATSSTLKYNNDNQSESEAWSEPDRSVSRARIGLVENTVGENCGKCSTDSTEEEELNQSTKSYLRKMISHESRNTIIDFKKQISHLEDKLNEKEKSYHETLQRNSKLEHEMANLQTKYQELLNKKKETEIEYNELVKEKENLLEKLSEIDAQRLQEINEVESEKSKALHAANKAEEAAECAKEKVILAENTISKLQEDIDNLETKFKTDYDNQLKLLEQQFITKIGEIQNDAETEIKTLVERIEQIEMEYSANYIKKCKVQEAFKEIDRLKKEMEIAQVQIEELTSEKLSIENSIKDYEEKINLLRSELDDTTLQYSEAVLEKTKIANEKAVLEENINRQMLKEVDAQKNLNQIENELSDLKQRHHKEISELQTEKFKLEIRISELESSNAELHNKLIKIQIGCGDHEPSACIIDSTSFVNNQPLFLSHDFEISQNIIPQNNALVRDPIHYPGLLAGHNLEVERQAANSSPDLGIESDHGRCSSLETHLNMQRPLFQTLEITQSMNTALDIDASKDHLGNGNNMYCCQKALEFFNENSVLKRKLLRTRKALEETVNQLTLANQRKKEVEKTICKQIHKTSQVLRKAKANLDSGSESDVNKNM